MTGAPRTRSRKAPVSTGDRLGEASNRTRGLLPPMNANPMQKTILVVDDDPDLLKLLALRLTAAGYLAQTAESGERALAVIAVSRPDVVVTDLKMGGMDGLALFEAIQRTAPTLPVIGSTMPVT